MHFNLVYDSSLCILKSPENDTILLETDNYQIAIYGDAFIDQKRNDLPTILAYCIQYHDEIVNHLEGLYYLFLLDKKNKSLSVYQDLFFGAETLYYTKLESIYYFSNTLQTLAQSSGISFTMNNDSRNLFAKFGFVPGANTLVNEVWKIAPRNKLFITAENVAQIPLQYNFTLKNTESAKAEWNDTLAHAIDTFVPDDSNFSMPLSGGYDSNYILHYLHHMKNSEFNLYTIGGHTGMDESSTVRKIAKFYRRHHLITAFTADNMINELPDIVWRLNGSVFERGIFLQYRLGKELYHHHEKYLICGECADQVMDIRFMADMLQSSVDNCVGKENVYDYAAYIILKKSGIMLNSFDIKGIYPYLNQRFLETAISLGCLNQKRKKFHKVNCEKVLSKTVSKIIHKEGGATSFHSLFSSKASALQFCQKVEASSLYRDIVGQTKILPKNIKQTKFNLLKSILLDLPEYWKVFWGRIESHSIETVFPSYRKTEQRIRNCLIVLYLELFNELFCSPRSKQYIEEGLKNFPNFF